MVAALCFGGTFLVVQGAVEDVEPVPFLAVRFTVAALVLWPLARRRPAQPGERRDGLWCGLALLTGYLFQTIGLQYTDAATSAFITYLLVVIVPLLGFALHRGGGPRRLHPATLGGVALAVGGLVLLTDPGDGDGFGRGEVLTLGCAVAFAVHVVVVGLACAGPGAVLGGYRFTAAALAAALATAVIATAVAFVLQVTGQRRVPPTRAALLLLLEPVFAGSLAGFDDDPLGPGQLLGAAVILAAVLLSELGPGLLDRRSDRRADRRTTGPARDRGLLDRRVKVREAGSDNGRNLLGRDRVEQGQEQGDERG